MSPSAYNDAFGWGDDHDRSSFVHYSSTLRQQPVPMNSSPNGFYWAGEPRQESYVPLGLASDTSSWSGGTAFADPRHPVRNGDAWSGGPHGAPRPPGPLFGAPGGNANALGTRTLVATEMATPVSEQAAPLAQRVLPTTQACLPPAPNWTHAPGPPWQSSWDHHHPVHTARQHSGHGGAIVSLGMRPNIPRVQQATTSVITGHPERRIILTDHIPTMVTPHSVQASRDTNPVPVITSAPRVQRWDLASDASTFQCMWRGGGTQCHALIAGDRKSVTSHLRDEHGFMCDGQTSVCAWGQCAARMQRRNIPRHILACHFEIKSPCPSCGLALSRADATRKHQRACAGNARTSAVMVVEGGEQDDGRLFF